MHESFKFENFDIENVVFSHNIGEMQRNQEAFIENCKGFPH